MILGTWGVRHRSVIFEFPPLKKVDFFRGGTRLQKKLPNLKTKGTLMTALASGFERYQIYGSEIAISKVILEK